MWISLLSDHEGILNVMMRFCNGNYLSQLTYIKSSKFNNPFSNKKLMELILIVNVAHTVQLSNVFWRINNAESHKSLLNLSITIALADQLLHIE